MASRSTYLYGSTLQHPRCALEDILALFRVNGVSGVFPMRAEITPHQLSTGRAISNSSRMGWVLEYIDQYLPNYTTFTKCFKKERYELY